MIAVAFIVSVFVAVSSAAPAAPESSVGAVFPLTIYVDSILLYSERNSDQAAGFQCIIDLIDKVVKKHGLEKDWEKVKKQINPHMEKLKKCNDKACSDKEAKAIVDLIQQYFIALSKENPQAAAEIGQGMPSCLPPSTYDRVSNDKTSSNGTGILPCAIEVGKNVTEQYELATVWEVFEPVLLGHLENITSCASAGNEEAVQACIAKERKSARRTYMEFLAAVKEVNELAEKEIKLLVGQRCYNMPAPTPVPTTPVATTTPTPTEAPTKSFFY